MATYLRQCLVDEAFKANAPKNGVILREECSFYDMDGICHVASIVKWYDENPRDIRISGFDAKTGQYLGEWN